MLATGDSGIISRLSAYPVEETVAKLTTLLKQRNITLFAIIDHSGEAEKAGLKMPPTKLLIFGNPKAGTPIMVASPSSAIDLPLKLLVSEDKGGMAWLSYNDPQYLMTRHHLPPELVTNISIVAALAEQAAK